MFNISLEPVSEDQFESRALIKAFSFAAAKAQSIYGVSEIEKKDIFSSVFIHWLFLLMNYFRLM